MKIENLSEEENPKLKRKRSKQAKRWRKFTKFMLSIQGIASLVAGVLTFILGVLPKNYFISIIILLLMFWLISLILLGTGTKKKDKAALKTKRKFGIVFSALVTIICILVSLMVGKLISTMGKISSHTTSKNTIGVYVLKDDPAQKISDATGYTFGHTGYYEKDTNNSLATVEAINKETGADIATKGDYMSVNDMVGALYSSEVGAIIMDEAYADVVEDMDEFENFTEETRIIYEYTVETELDKNEDVGDITTDPFVVYLSGSDTRNLTLAKSRSDVNILAVVNPSTKEILLINTPRDYYVSVPMSSDLKDKLTHCGLYGVDCSMETLGNLYGVDVNYYSQINFNGLEALVDAVGGVTVESDRDFTTSRKASQDGTKYSFVKGENKVNGAQALAFARERKKLKDGDVGRGIHQMAVIKGIINKLQSPEILTGYSGIMDSLGDMVATDMADSEMKSLVQMQLDDMSSWNIKSYTVTGTGEKNYTYSMPSKRAYTMIPDEDSVNLAKSLMQKVINGGSITDDDLEGKTADSTEQ